MTSGPKKGRLVVIPDPIDHAGVSILEEKLQVCHGAGRNAVSVSDDIMRADAVVVRNFPLRSDLISRCPRLSVIAKHGVGIDNIDLEEATRLGIVVANVPGANACGVAEGAVALMLAAIRHTPAVHRQVAAGNWDIRWQLHYEQLFGRTLGVVGFGKIGALVAQICRSGFGMRVIAYDPFVNEEEMMGRATKAEELSQLLQVADVVTLHMPLIPETYHLIGIEELKLMKRIAVLVNTARGGLVDSSALHEALSNGWIAGAGIDVLEFEPPSKDDPLLRLENIVLTPHTAGSTKEADRIVAVEAAKIVTHTIGGEMPKGILNPEVWPRRRTSRSDAKNPAVSNNAALGN